MEAVVAEATEEVADIITATITTKDEVVVTKATTLEMVVTVVDTIKTNSSSSLNSCILHTKSP